MKKLSVLCMLLIFCASIFAGCMTTNQRSDGSYGGQRSNVGYCALLGAGFGGAIGASGGRRHRTANTIIGSLIGAAVGAVVCEVLESTARQAAIEAARTQRPVTYRTDEGQQVRATPAAYNPRSSCQEIKNEAWDTDGTYLGSVNRTVCRDSNGNLDVRT